MTSGDEGMVHLELPEVRSAADVMPIQSRLM